MMTGPPIPLVAGQPTSLAIQCYLRGTSPATGNPVPAMFNSTDILSCAIYPSGQTVPVCTPAVTFYTANGGQLGYSQGQVNPTLSHANMVLLQPGVSYTLLVWRALASASTILELIVRAPLVIEAIAA
jgi:hypothetical protein